MRPGRHPGSARSGRRGPTQRPAQRRSCAPGSAGMIIVDTAPLVAAAIQNDQDHDRCAEVFERMHRERQHLVVPCYVVAETCYMLARDGGNRPAAQFLRSLDGRTFRQIDLDYQDTLRAAELLETYADLG